MTKAIQPETPMPKFTLPSTIGETVSSDSLLGAPTVIAFYPSAWSPGCSSQMPLYQEGLHLITEQGAKLLAISTDGLWTLKAWTGSMNLSYPLLSDFNPHGAVAKAFGVLRADGRAERAIFVVDGEGIIRFAHVSPQLGIVPGLDIVLKGLEAASIK
jgi:peroxiredoxin